MKLEVGMFLRSTDALTDTLFADVIIFLTEYNANGAAGFIVNKPYGRSLHELEEFQHSIPFPLYDGGPVDKEHLFVLHQRPDLIEDAASVGNGIHFGGNFKQVVAAINSDGITSSQIKIFVGYCGWDAGELEAEIAEGSWTLAEEEKYAVFK